MGSVEAGGGDSFRSHWEIFCCSQRLHHQSHHWDSFPSPPFHLRWTYPSPGLTPVQIRYTYQCTTLAWCICVPRALQSWTLLALANSKHVGESAYHWLCLWSAYGMTFYYQYMYTCITCSPFIVDCYIKSLNLRIIYKISSTMGTSSS